MNQIPKIELPDLSAEEAAKLLGMTASHLNYTRTARPHLHPTAECFYRMGMYIRYRRAETIAWGIRVGWIKDTPDLTTIEAAKLLGMTADNLGTARTASPHRHPPPECYYRLGRGFRYRRAETIAWGIRVGRIKEPPPV